MHLNVFLLGAQIRVFWSFFLSVNDTPGAGVGANTGIILKPKIWNCELCKVTVISLTMLETALSYVGNNNAQCVYAITISINILITDK